MSTPRPIGEVLVANVTVQSATKRKNRRGDGTEWAIRAFIPAFGIQDFATPFTIPGNWATEILEGDTVRCQLIRAKLKNTEEGVPRAGDKDHHYFWNCQEWATDEPLTELAPITQTDAAQGNTPRQPGSNPQDDYRRSKEEMRWTEAVHLATRLLSGNMMPQSWATGIPMGKSVGAYIMEWATWYYNTIIDGPPEPELEMPQDGATEAAEPPPEPELGPPPAEPAPAPIPALKAGTRCPATGHSMFTLLLVEGDPTPKHPIVVSVDGQRVLDHWCYGEG